VTELVTNAVKYAYPDGGGEIRVRLKKLAENEAELMVGDDGPGFSPDAAPKGGGLGRMIIKAMASQLRSEVVYGTGPGSCAKLRFAQT
jgi:two-component sensor histidine kinase